MGIDSAVYVNAATNGKEDMYEQGRGVNSAID